MTTLSLVGLVFGVFAAGFIILLIYRSTLTMHQEDALYLDDANSQMQEEQTTLLTRVNRLTIPVRVLGAGTGVFALILIGMWVSQKLAESQ